MWMDVRDVALCLCGCLWMLIPFYVTAFFFVSGYLFFRKYLNTNALYGGGISILYRIVIPTILFSTILYLPKTLFHGENMNVKRMLFNVLGGIGFWFTSALVVAQLSLLLMMKIKRNAIWLYIILSLVLFVIGLYLNLQRTSADASSFFPWFYMTGFEYTLVMGIGGFYWKYEMAIDRYIKYLWIGQYIIFDFCALSKYSITLSSNLFFSF